MRVRFFDCRTRAACKKYCPWAAVIAKVEGGFLAFECADAYKRWKAQR